MKTEGRKKINTLTDVKSSSWLVVGETEEPLHFHLSIDSTQWSSSRQMRLSVLCSPPHCYHCTLASHFYSLYSAITCNAQANRLFTPPRDTEWKMSDTESVRGSECQRRWSVSVLMRCTDDAGQWTVEHRVLRRLTSR